MNVYELISKVQHNPPIWDKRIKDYVNRSAVDACWRKISLEMKIDGAVLRKKWKYLRDQFTVECSKVMQSRSEDAAETSTEPRWPYYKSMLFLKDIVKPRASSTFKKAPSVTDDGDDEQEYEGSIGADIQETENIYIRLEGRKALNDDLIETQPAESNEPNDSFESQPKRRKRMVANSLYNENVLQLEQQDISSVQSVFHREPDNDDLMFFKSLMPFVSKIPVEKKLSFRSRINQVVEEFAFAGEHSQQISQKTFINS